LIKYQQYIVTPNENTMKMKFLIILAVAGMAIAGCSSSKESNGTMDSSAVDSARTDSTMVDTTKKVPDTTKQVN
jgi:ABC-type Fe3+-citrate transport system substrate-binding protein